MGKGVERQKKTKVKRKGLVPKPFQRQNSEKGKVYKRKEHAQWARKGSTRKRELGKRSPNREAGKRKSATLTCGGRKNAKRKARLESLQGHDKVRS